MIRKVFFLAFVFVGTALPGAAQKPTLKDTLQKIDKLFAGWNTTTPGGSLLVSRHGVVLYQKAFGMADLEHNIVNTPATIFEAGSVSKQFTAAAVLLLVREGKIGLQDDIRKYFPDFPGYGTPITVEHLLHHTSGLRDWGVVAGIGGWPRGTRIYRPEHVREIIWRQKELNFTPGTEYSYSNSNYNMLVFLVEKVSGQSHQAFTRERLFGPMGMTSTKWRDNFQEVVPDRSMAYSGSSNAYRLNMPFENTFGHGALLTTTEDLEKWNQRWKNNALGADINQLQKAKTRLINGKEITYAGGVVVDQFNHSEEISHSGATAGYRAWLAYYPGEGLSVVFLSNYGNTNPGRIGREVAEIFIGAPATRKLPEYTAIPVNPQTLTGKSGLYRSINGEDVQELAVKDDSLRFKSSGIALTPAAGNRFFLREGFLLTFPDNTSNPSYFLMKNPGGDTGTYIRVTPFNPTDKELAAFAGTYFSEEADATLIGDVYEGKFRLLQKPDNYFILAPSYTDVFFEDWGTVYRFIRNKKKQITGFTVTTGRVRNLLFKKMN